MSGYELPLVVLMCGYNIAPWVENSIKSVVDQLYTNYRVVFVDDGSEDGTADIVAMAAQKYGLKNQLTLVRNKKRRRKLANMYDAIHSFDDKEIVVLLDADDKLAHERVLQTINTTYQKYNPWFAYSQYKNEPKEEARKWGYREIGHSAPVSKKIEQLRAYRQSTFVFMHLRSFYAWLFKQIKLEDLIAKNIKGFCGDFYPAANDLAIMFPMVEMAKNKVQFIDEILCIRNLYPDHIGFKKDRKIQSKSGAEIRAKNKYPIVEEKIFAPITQKFGRIDACIMCKNDLSGVIKMVYLLRKQCKGLRSIVVVCEQTAKNIQDLKKMRKSVNVDVCFYTQEKSIADQLKQYCDAHKTQYLLLCTDIPVLHKTIDAKHAARLLAKTGAYAFYCECDGPPRPHVRFADACAWTFCCVPERWQKPYGLGLALYKSNDVIAWLHGNNVSMDCVGLCAKGCLWENGHE